MESKTSRMISDLITKASYALKGEYDNWILKNYFFIDKEFCIVIKHPYYDSYKCFNECGVEHEYISDSDVSENEPICILDLEYIEYKAKHN
jgi:hypothetical protein